MITLAGYLFDLSDPADRARIVEIFLSDLPVDHDPQEAGSVNGQPVGERDSGAVAGEVG